MLKQLESKLSFTICPKIDEALPGTDLSSRYVTVRSVFRLKIDDLKISIKCLVALLMLLFIALSGNAQQKNRRDVIYPISLDQAIMLSKSQNKDVQAAKLEETAVRSDQIATKVLAMPDIELQGNYQRYTKLTLFNDFLYHANSVSVFPSPNAGMAGAVTTFNLYAGGRQKTANAAQSYKVLLAGLNVMDRGGDVSLHVATDYLELEALNDQLRYIKEQIVRAETRVRNINSLYVNQKVTRSDVLRAQLNLSSVNLDLERTQNDIKIASKKLVVLLDLPDNSVINPTDSANMQRVSPKKIHSLFPGIADDSYSVRKAVLAIKLQTEEVNAIKSNNRPAITLISTYSLNYPNALVYPHVDQAYALGYAGLNISYSLSSIYKNKLALAAARIRSEELLLQKQSASDSFNQEFSSLLIKYQEALDRIKVNEQSIEQARVNYRIVNTKYLNQLALLTDLLDADNLLQEVRYNLVEAQTNAQLFYFRLLYLSGKL
ncbi:TolC family protein [Mucilaginibacter sp. SG564]|uniref:TolC family protein n=1 Tax=Mucilaginibacter sp. SG564 TaxID=2587022 RepID=UPI001554A949|nr:TolC family protein [Mucilaginibacter sp. SG564]NOW95943.1 outer membrane protein TolC [Mucilaginibacter sp. SG564]